MTQTAATLRAPRTGPSLTRSRRGQPSLVRQAALQALTIGILLTVLFPIVWVVAISLDPLNRSRPEGLSLIPSNATL
jgi:ABC-type glycerol-3-phosphate transport system permease component